MCIDSQSDIHNFSKMIFGDVAICLSLLMIILYRMQNIFVALGIKSTH